MQNIYYNHIPADIHNRRINSLIHFTAASNINSILQNGILSKATLNQYHIEHAYNDEMRLDGFPNSISLSIEFPNYSMFSKYRIYDSNSKDMVIIQIDPRVLLDKDCAFYYTNAASKDFHNVNPQSLKDYGAWSSMFAENYKGIQRNQLNLPSNYTTHPQAEVLCFNKIEPHYIKCITFENQYHFDKNYMKYNYPSWPFSRGLYVLNNSYYNARFDYQYWKSNK